MLFKIWAITLMMFIAFTHVFAADESIDTQKQSLTFIYQHEDFTAFFEKAALQFQQKTGIIINTLLVADHELKTILIKGQINNQLPDLAFAPSDYCSLRHQVPFSKIDPKLFNPNVPVNQYDTTFNEDGFYAVPIVKGNHLLFYYNKKYVSSPAKTWKDMLAQQQAFTEKNIQTIGWNYNEMYWLIPFIGAFQGWPNANNTLTLNTVAVQNALAFYKAQSDQGLIDKACDYDCSFKHFLEGKTAYSINGAWAMNTMHEILKDDLGVALLPKINGNNMIPMYSSLAIIFPGNSLDSNKREALIAFTNYIQSDNMQIELFKDYQMLPVSRVAETYMHTHASEVTMQSLAQLQLSQPMTAENSMQSAWIGMRKGFVRYLNNLATVEEATLLMQSYAEKELEHLKNAKSQQESAE